MQRSIADSIHANERNSAPQVEITFGGSNANICHGSGVSTKTLSDLVVAVEFVNALGEVQIVSDPDQLKAVAGSFGLFGVVTCLTLRMDEMTIAKMNTKKIQVQCTIPPYEGFVVPKKLQKKDKSSEWMRQEGWDKFVHSVKNDYYVEWFWFVWSGECWVNCWDTARKEDIPEDDIREEYPGEAKTKFQEAMETMAHLANSTVFKAYPPKFQIKMFSTMAITALPEEQVNTYVVNALHFQRGIHNMRVYDLELEIPIEAKADDPNEPDLEVVKKAWWDIIALTYDKEFKKKEDYPLRLALEMRIFGGSDIHMAPVAGNKWTCSIEVLTTQDTHLDKWEHFMQRVTDAWCKLHPNVRPHWAKQLPKTMYGMDTKDWIREAYKENILRFREAMIAVGKCAEGGTIQPKDNQMMFSNPFFDYVLDKLWQ